MGCYGFQGTHHAGDDDEFSGQVALSDDHLLRQKQFLRRNVHTEIAARKQDPVRRVDDLLRVQKTILVLKLRDDGDLAQSQAAENRGWGLWFEQLGFGIRVKWI